MRSDFIPAQAGHRYARSRDYGIDAPDDDTSFAAAPMPDLIQTFTERGDLAHLALLLWAMSASALAWFALRELTAASRRFDDFVRELARFNEHFGGK